MIRLLTTRPLRKKIPVFLPILLVLAGLTVDCYAQRGASDYDVRHYRIEAQLIPSSQLLKAVTAVSFTPSADTRSVVFEMNGSLLIRKINRLDLQPASAAATSAETPPPTLQRSTAPGQAREARRSSKPAASPQTPPPAPPAEPPGLQFIQDNRENMNVRIDLGNVVAAGTEVTLVFEYEGALESPQGGPISSTRLASVSEQGSYLFYAARWFPFHDYAADRATYELIVKVPKGDLVTGYSDKPISIATAIDPKTKEETSTYHLSSSTPVLPGSIAAGKYLVRSESHGGYLVDFYVKAGDENWADQAASVIGRHLEFYSEKFGEYAFGKRLVVVETDDETLETYSGAGIIFLSPRVLKGGINERLAREVAYQWWGQTVGLRSFDDTFLSQGMAEFSALLYTIERENEATSRQALQGELEKALAFEQSASIRTAPSQLDDQSAAFRSVIFYKGALVLSMLRQLMGTEIFDRMLRDYYQTYAGRNITLDEFEAFASKVAGRDLRFFFGQWVDSTGVPEFRSDYRVLRNRDGFRVPGTIRQDLDTFEMPVDIVLRTEAGSERLTLLMKGTSADFDITTRSKPLEIIVDPDARILRSSDELRQGVIVRRGIEHFRVQEYVEAEQQFQAAIKLNRGNSWAWYNLGLLYIEQRNWNKALDAFDQCLNGSIRPDWIEVWSYIYRGNCWDMIGQRERAVAEYNKAISNGSDYGDAQSTAQKYRGSPYGRKATPENGNSDDK